MMYFFHVYGAKFMDKDEPRRHELMMSGIIKRMPLKAVDHSQRLGEVVKLQFRRPATTKTNLSDPWDSYCEVSSIFVFATTDWIRVV